ncbi:MAG: hypothetical protein WC869_08100 [Phycisphaerae bacterium]|jgi:hypothetical protein
MVTAAEASMARADPTTVFEEPFIAYRARRTHIAPAPVDPKLLGVLAQSIASLEKTKSELQGRAIDSWTDYHTRTLASIADMMDAIMSSQAINNQAKADLIGALQRYNAEQSADANFYVADDKTTAAIQTTVQPGIVAGLSKLIPEAGQPSRLKVIADQAPGNPEAQANAVAGALWANMQQEAVKANALLQGVADPGKMAPTAYNAVMSGMNTIDAQQRGGMLAGVDPAVANAALGIVKQKWSETVTAGMDPAAMATLQSKQEKAKQWEAYMQGEVNKLGVGTPMQKEAQRIIQRGEGPFKNGIYAYGETLESLPMGREIQKDIDYLRAMMRQDPGTLDPWEKATAAFSASWPGLENWADAMHFRNTDEAMRYAAYHPAEVKIAKAWMEQNPELGDVYNADAPRALRRMIIAEGDARGFGFRASPLGRLLGGPHILGGVVLAVGDAVKSLSPKAQDEKALEAYGAETPIPALDERGLTERQAAAVDAAKEAPVRNAPAATPASAPAASKPSVPAAPTAPAAQPSATAQYNGAPVRQDAEQPQYAVSATGEPLEWQAAQGGWTPVTAGEPVEVPIGPPPMVPMPGEGPATAAAPEAIETPIPEDAVPEPGAPAQPEPVRNSFEIPEQPVLMTPEREAEATAVPEGRRVETPGEADMRQVVDAGKNAISGAAERVGDFGRALGSEAAGMLLDASPERAAPPPPEPARAAPPEPQPYQDTGFNGTLGAILRGAKTPAAYLDEAYNPFRDPYRQTRRG